VQEAMKKNEEVRKKVMQLMAANPMKLKRMPLVPSYASVCDSET
jgi:hypothetical protein